MFSASFLPSVLVPFTVLVVPAIAMSLLLIYIEREDPSGI